MYMIMYISDDTFWNRLIDLINCSIDKYFAKLRTC